MTLLHPHLLLLLPLSAILWLLVYSGQTKTRDWQKTWGQASPAFAFLHPWLLGAASFVLILALARPVWDPQPVDRKASGQDTVFLIDVSRSMDTPDINGGARLAAVKQALLDLLPALEGDRVALVAFAGTTVPKCPLTMDYGFVQQSIALLDTTSTSRGGTLLGDALRTVRKDFAADGRKLSVWVFTDGGDQESFPVEAAREYGDSALSLYIWGVGTLGGGQVPERGVSSALNETLLSDVAKAVPGGVYYGSASRLWSLPLEYQKHHRASSVSTVTRVVWQEGSWWLLWPALALMAFDTAIRLNCFKRRKRP